MFSIFKLSNYLHICDQIEFLILKLCIPNDKTNEKNRFRHFPIAMSFHLIFVSVKYVTNKWKY